MKKFLTSLILFIILLMPNVSKAAITCSTDKHKAEASIDKDKIKIGETAQIIVKSEDTYQVEYKIAPKDFATINDEGLVKAIKDGSIKINLTINYLKENDEIDDTCKISIPLEITSNDSSLKKLTLDEFDISSIFKSNKLDYEIKLPYKFEQINIKAEASSGTAKITGTGKRYLNEGNNEYNIVVTASDGTSTTYKITIIREEASDDATLKNLVIEGLSLSPKFQKDIYKYNLEVDKDVEEITIKGEPANESSKVYGIGKIKLATGINTHYIKVVAENGSEVKYELVINKNLGTSNLTSLEVVGYNLNPAFNSETYTYNLTIPNNITKLDINAVGNENDQIEIIGNENLKDGENEILISIINNDKTTTTYKLIVNKLTKEKETTIKKNNIVINILLIIFIISIIIMASCILIFIKRNYKRKIVLDLKNKKVNNKKNKR